MNLPVRVTAVAGLWLIAACASPPAKERVPGNGGAVTAQNDGAADAAFDWHPLVVEPFGTRLVDSPIALHEVLLFQEEPHATPEVESKDCFAVDGAPPTFGGNPPDEYLLCFEHDRLDRIDASVRIAAGDAAEDFGRACARWLRTAKSLPAAANACAGRDGDIAFSARLAVMPGESTAELLITLSDAAKRDAEQEPEDSPGATP